MTIGLELIEANGAEHWMYRYSEKTTQDILFSLNRGLFHSRKERRYTVQCLRENQGPVVQLDNPESLERYEFKTDKIIFLGRTIVIDEKIVV